MLIGSWPICSAGETAAHECLRLPAELSPAETDLALKLYQEILSSLDQPEPAVAYNFKLVEAFARPDEHALEQLVLVRALICLRDHHAEKLRGGVFDQMQLNLTFAIAKSMRERSLPAAKEKWAKTKYGVPLLEALRQLGI